MPGFTYGDGTGSTYGEDSGSTYGTPLPRQVENLAVADTRAEEVDLSWDAAGSATEYVVYQAEASGTTTGDYTEVATTANTSATVTGLENGERYYYRVAGRNDVGEGDLSNEVDTVTDLPATEITAIDDATLRELTLTLDPQDNSTDGGIDIYRSTDGTLGAVVASLSPDTTSYTDTALDDGTEYHYTARRFTDHAEADGTQQSETTILPDEDAPVLGNGVKDEVAVDRETAVSNAGDVRYQIRRTEDDTATWEDADSFQQFIGAFNTLTFEFVGLLDGEEYEVRGRTETADVTGAWTTPTTIVTKFPGFDNFQITATRENEVDLSWEDFADNEDGTRVQRRARIAGAFGPWDTIETLPPTEGEGETVTYTDTTAPSGMVLEYRIQPFTAFTSATSDPIETTTGGTNERNVSASGYHVEVVHPTTGRVRSPETIGHQGIPAVNPGPNAQPRLRLPVRKDDVWLSSAYDADPEMRVWRDGRRLPIEVLRDIEQREDATVLVGVGGVELETRVQAEFNDDRRHIAAGDLVTTNTTYAVDAPEPDTATLQDVVQQDPDTQAEFESVSSEGATSSLSIGNVVTQHQTCFTVEGGARDRDGNGATFYTLGDYSDGAAFGVDDAGEFAEWDFTTEHTIPEAEFGVHIRHGPATDLGGMELSVELDNGTSQTIDFLDSGVGLMLTWRDHGQNPFNGTGWTGGDVPPGTHTIRLEGTGSGDEFAADVVAPADNRFSYNFDNDNGGDGGYLDGPGFHGTVTATFDNSPSAFNVVAGDATVTINDTSGAQRLQISNDNGGTWLPDDGTQNNTKSVAVDYPDAGSGSRLRVTLDAYSPQGARDQTPRFNYAPQELDAYTLRADITQELLLIEETFDNDLASVLTSMAEPAERSWRFAFEDGTPTVRFVQNGQFEADFTPEFMDRTREKLGKTYQSVTIKGSNEPVSNEPYTASTTFSVLSRSNVLPGSESVYDDATNYERGDDYEIRYRTGEIRATSGGNLTAGDAYRIDYQFQAEGTFEIPNAPTDPDELVETVTGVTSTRLAEQVAFVLASDVSTPRYAAEVTIPDPDPRFDPTDALPSTALGLPDGLSALEVRGEPQLTPRGLQVRLGTRPAVEASLQRLGRQVSRVSDRS